MAAYGPTTQFLGSWHFFCSGAFSCSSMKSITLQANKRIRDSVMDVWCQASNACSNTTLHIGYNQSMLLCYGMNACAASNIYYHNATSGLHCAGYRSCAFANLYGMRTVSAWGSSALYRAVLDTTGIISTNFYVYLYSPYAAYGAHLKCQLSHTCYIYCKSLTACYNFYIDCGPGSNCVVESPKGRTIPNDNLPLTKLTDFNNINYDLTILADFPGAIVEINTNILCPNNGTFDDTNLELFPNNGSHIPIVTFGQNITLKIDDEGPICCRASHACVYEWGNTTRIQYETQKKTDLICSGSYACLDVRVSNINDTLFCEGWQSCWRSSVNYVEYVYCSATKSCEDSNFIGAKYVKCDGFWSCYLTTIISGGTDLFLYLNGGYSGANVMIFCNKTDVCTVNCVGFQSCLNTQIVCNTAAANCIINCDIKIVETCPVILTYSPTQSPTFVTLYPSQTPSSNTIDQSLYPSLYPTFDPIFDSTSITLYPSQTTFSPSYIPSASPSNHRDMNPSDIFTSESIVHNSA
eukprot:969017_1